MVGPDAAIALPEIGVAIPLAEIYDDVLPEGEQAVAPKLGPKPRPRLANAVFMATPGRPPRL